MNCRKPDFLYLNPTSQQDIEDRPELPDKLTDYLTGKEIPFTNRDNIKQKILHFLIDEKEYQKTDISLDREIRFDLEGQIICSFVDISIIFKNITVLIWKCASGSIVTRERQIIASARLLEDYVIPYAAVTNGRDMELLDVSSEKVITEGFQSFPPRQDLFKMTENMHLKPANKKKLINEQRILYTYDAISCPVNLKK